MYSACLSICKFGCIYPINFKTTEPIRPKFVWEGLWNIKI